MGIIHFLCYIIAVIETVPLDVLSLF